jgi:hypothetical protein
MEGPVSYHVEDDLSLGGVPVDGLNVDSNGSCGKESRRTGMKVSI